ncbi:MAG: hypothetical protein NUW00_01620 [Candidatus Kaiserbacteria bacterium]|nr:hypothetical protein [Candidatus Kaiserbacteria bacterium]
MKSVNITGTDIAWVMFAVIMSGLGTVALTKSSTIKEPDAVAQAHQATMKEQLLTTTPGDLVIQKGGYIVTLGAGMHYAVSHDEVNFTGLNWAKNEHRKIEIFVLNVEWIVRKDNPNYGAVASCFLQGRSVTVVDHRYTC